MTRAHDESLCRKRREELGFTLKEFADKLGRNAAFVSHMEHGYVPQIERREQVAVALATTPDLLWPAEYA